ncbi:MAG: hypothetical protein DWQ34_23490 [Planctomycetota bacterium]|nr:MAG: hypothetical protein DWQ34_23490 [Planctomycetota bacterium]REK19834.1 MAG: hypothetical protein DWQ41_27370 [Planctomycetota bacterium]
MADSTKKARPRKSKAKRIEKPYDGFPLFPHATNRWAKKIRGKLHYFGKTTDDPKGAAALERFNREWPYLSEGRTPPPPDTSDFCSVRDLCNAFLTSKRNKLLAGELAERTFRDYYVTAERLVTYFGRDRRVDGLRPDDFEGLRSQLAEKLGVVSLRNEINRCRVVFKYAHDQRLIERPVNFGQSFNRPSAKMLRQSRNESGAKLFERDELVAILKLLEGKPVSVDGEEKPVRVKEDPALRAMVLLGLNCGFGNTDVASLPQSAVDFDAGWVEFPRPKTAIQRRIPLWPETVAALRAAIAVRPAPKDDADSDLCFITLQGHRYVKTKPKRGSDSPQTFVTTNTIAARFSTVLKKLHINGRHRLNFYTLRHTFETIAGESRDQVAVNAIMGHVDNSMAAVYRERISDERLRAVVETVRGWLWGVK